MLPVTSEMLPVTRKECWTVVGIKLRVPALAPRVTANQDRTGLVSFEQREGESRTLNNTYVSPPLIKSLICGIQWSRFLSKNRSRQGRTFERRYKGLGVVPRECALKAWSANRHECRLLNNLKLKSTYIPVTIPRAPPANVVWLFSVRCKPSIVAKNLIGENSIVFVQADSLWTPVDSHTGGLQTDTEPILKHFFLKLYHINTSPQITRVRCLKKSLPTLYNEYWNENRLKKPVLFEFVLLRRLP